jgi:hypothetical protein
MKEIFFLGSCDEKFIYNLNKYSGGKYGSTSIL